MACVNLIRRWTTSILHSFSQETDLLMKVIMKCVNIKLWDILGCFHYILNAPRISLTARNVLDTIMTDQSNQSDSAAETKETVMYKM